MSLNLGLTHAGILEMSLYGTLIIMAVIVIRALAIYKLPKKTFLALWFVALFRLLIPFSVPSQVSVLNLQHLFEDWNVTETAAMPAIAIDMAEAHPIPAVQIVRDVYSSPVISEAVAEVYTSAPGLFNTAFNIESLAMIYFTGLALMSVFFITVYVRYRKDFADSQIIDNEFIDNWLAENPLKRRISVRVSKKITTPLTYGIFNPVMLLPKSTDWTNEHELGFILSHEFVHIRRFDALTKLVVTAVLCIHWFNPLVWIMYFLFNRDMEIACDEEVVKMIGQYYKGNYALTLINMVERAPQMPALHSNFSRYAIEERINAIMKNKKGTLLQTVTSFVLVITMAAVFTTGSVNAAATGYVREESESQMQMQRLTVNEGRIRDVPPGPDSIPIEEAAAVGMEAIEMLFVQTLNAATIEMVYLPKTEFSVIVFEMSDNPTWERPPNRHEEYSVKFTQYFLENADTSRRFTPGVFDAGSYLQNAFPEVDLNNFWLSINFESPSAWMGHEIINQHSYFFSVHAETGELLSANRRVIRELPHHVNNPYGIERIVVERTVNEAATAQHNYEAARFVMEIAENLNLFESEVARAKIATYMPGFSSDIVYAASYALLHVESVNGELIELMIMGLIEGDMQLAGLSTSLFSTPGRMDLETGLFEPGAPFVWVYR